MITCSECGFAAHEVAKFCDRCGQALVRTAAPPPLLPPLKVGTVLKGGFEIVELLAGGSEENRYRGTRRLDGKNESFQLRERMGPAAREREPGADVSAPAATEPATEEDPNGPRARTRELKLPGAGTSVKAAATGALAAAPPSSLESGVAGSAEVSRPSSSPSELTEAVVEAIGAAERSVADENGQVEPGGADETPCQAVTADGAVSSGAAPADDLGDTFGRVHALSLTITHPAFQRALAGFAQNDRVYLVYPDEALTPLSRRAGAMREPEALGIAIQVCQAVSVLHRRALRVNDICPASVVFAPDGRVTLTGLDYVSNDTELQSQPIFNDGFTAPEIYKGKKVDKRADVFSVGALLYACLTGARIEVETWREEAGAVVFYPAHVVSPALEQVVRKALAFDPQDRWQTVDALKSELLRLNGLVRVRAAALTDVGMVRELNEDSVMAIEYSRQSLIEPAQNYLYMVADGMGGAAAGEIASAIAVATVRDYVESKLVTAEAKDPCQLLKSALEEANRRILESQAANPEMRGMGSTAVCTLILPPDAALAWVGDSRIYLCEGPTIRPLTKDHSLVQRLIEIGQLTAEQARHHEHKNVITRSLGARQSGPAGAEAHAIRLKRGDRMVLCSDGLTTHVEDERIGEIVRRNNDPYEAGRELVVAANAGGGTDNVSVVVIFAE
jgi:protein phosphatase